MSERRTNFHRNPGSTGIVVRIVDIIINKFWPIPLGLGWNKWVHLILEWGPLNSRLKPSLSRKMISITNLTIKLLNKHLSDLSIGVHLKSSL